MKSKCSPIQRSCINGILGLTQFYFIFLKRKIGSVACKLDVNHVFHVSLLKPERSTNQPIAVRSVWSTWLDPFSGCRTRCLLIRATMPKRKGNCRQASLRDIFSYLLIVNCHYTTLLQFCQHKTMFDSIYQKIHRHVLKLNGLLSSEYAH